VAVLSACEESSEMPILLIFSLLIRQYHDASTCPLGGLVVHHDTLGARASETQASAAAEQIGLLASTSRKHSCCLHGVETLGPYTQPKRVLPIM